jgi:hypothetical protein
MFDPTLLGLLSQIEEEQIVLPAMQRPFVWKEERIYRLIDSLLRGFPIGAVMLWKTKSIQRYRKLNKDIDSEQTQNYAYQTSENADSKYLVLDGQQRLTSLFSAFKGTYNDKKLFVDVLSGNPEDKDPGDEYYDCKFLDARYAIELNQSNGTNGNKRYFVPIEELIRINPVNAAKLASKKAVELNLDNEETERITDVYLRCATMLGSKESLQVIFVDNDPTTSTPLEEILEIFVRVNSGGMVLQKSDLLMSLLDLKWNDIQPELQNVVKSINEKKPFSFTRDDVLKSLLLSVGSETRFDKLVSDRDKVASLATSMPKHIPQIKTAWELLGVILVDDCKIYSERFFKGGHRSLLPFVLYISLNQKLSKEDRKKIVIGIYLSVMSGIFAGAEARMGAFSRNVIKSSTDFPLNELCQLVKRVYGIDSLDGLLKRDLDLTLNIAHGGISLDKNPENLQRDHIFPRSKLIAKKLPYEVVNHYANFHFLRATDNGNKTDKDPDVWFKNPGKGIVAYTDTDLDERLLTWDNLKKNNFHKMISERGKKIIEKAEQLFGLSEEEFNNLFK